jgi:hypothetical protein
MALNCYHKAHFLKHEDALTEELIQRALHDVNEYSGITTGLSAGIFPTDDNMMFGLGAGSNMIGGGLFLH